MQTKIDLGPAPAISKREIIALIAEIGRSLGLTAASQAVAIRLIGQTAEKDWTDAAAKPVNFASQDSLAESLGIAPRTLREHEAKLEALGIIDRSPLANGHRRPSAKIGLSLEPLKARVEELLDVRERQRADRRAKADLRGRRSACVRALRIQRDRLDGAAPSPEAADFLEAAAAWPRSDALARWSREALEAHIGQAERLIADLADAITRQVAAAAAASAGLPPPPPPDPRHAALAAEATPPSPKGEEAARLLSPASLRSLASPEFREHHDLLNPDRRPSDRTIRETAEARRPILGISEDAWKRACRELSPPLAALALLIVDANRDHPTAPVRDAGGYFRWTIEAAAEGRFAVIGALRSLARRRRAEAPPDG